MTSKPIKRAPAGWGGEGAAVALLLAIVPQAASGQALAQLPQADISRQRVAPLPLPQQDFDLRIQNPEKAPTPRAVDEIEFEVSAIRIVGADHLDAGAGHAFFAPLEHRKIVLQELRDAAQKLEQHYRAKGYFLTRVIVPPQKVRDGVLEVQVIEGYVDAAFVDAPNDRARTLIERMVRPIPAEQPLRLAALEQVLLRGNDLPGLTLTSVLRPGALPGSSDLVLTVKNRPTQFFASYSNSGSDTLGPSMYTVGASLQDPLHRPGALDISYSAAGPGLAELGATSLRYSMPVGSRGAILSLGGVLANARPGGAISDLDVHSHSVSGNIRLRVPLQRERRNSFYLDLALTVNRSKVRALGQPLSDDRSTVAELSVNWQQAGWAGGQMSLGASVLRGVNMLGALGADAALPSVPGFEPNFTKVTFQFQRSQPLYRQLSLLLSAQGQYSGDLLVSGEQVSFGGSMLGRGYDPSLLTGDRPIGGSAQLQLGLPKLKVDGRVEGASLYGFFDWATATTIAHGSMPAVSGSLASLGLGLRFTVLRHVGLDLQLADARKDLPASTRHGARFTLGANLFF